MRQQTAIDASLLSRRVYNAPPQPTPFFGRQAEIADITERLADPRCRLLTLTGPGGIGKTRLALRAATALLGSFAHGNCFIPLQSVSSSDLLAAAVADALGVPLSGSVDPTARLRTYLSGKDFLLILDNFEHLLGDGGAEVLPDLLHAAPALKLLVTSREALKLQEEWRYDVGALRVPTSDQAADLESYEVIQLFVERAQRACGDFSLVDDRAGVVRVCQLVEGVPLAIELAASWTNVLRCDVIAAEIERGLQFLRTDLRNIPDRHRSMQAVFEQSWQLLSWDERSIFARLAVFRGGFRHEAAEQIATSSLPILAALVRKSLLRREPDGCYHMHELLRQYAEERLGQAAPEEAIHTRDRHCAYYLTFVSERDRAMNGGQQLQATAEVAAELDNVRTAWLWAVERRNIALLAGAANALYLFCQFRSRYLEGSQLWERAVQALDDEALVAHPDAVLLLYQLGMFHVRLGRLERAQALFERCQAICQALGMLPGRGRSSDARLGLGLMASLRGDYTEAQRLLEQARQASLQSGHLGNECTADYYLAGVHLAQGQYRAAQQHAESAYALAQAAQDRWFMAYCLNELGNVARALHVYEQARRYYQASYTLRAEFDDPEGMAVAQAELGAVAMLQGDFEAAQDLYRQSLRIYRDINDQGGLATALEGLGRALCARGQAQAAAKHLRDALQIATTAQLTTLQLSLAMSIGQLLLQTGRLEAGIEALLFVRQQPASTREARDHAQHLLEPYLSRISPHVAERGHLNDLQALTIRLGAELAAVEVQAQPAPCTDRAAKPSVQSLIEELTPRERELLQLLAAGCSYREIAEKLTIAVGSVKSHCHNIYGKLGVRNRVQAASRAAELGLL